MPILRRRLQRKRSQRVLLQNAMNIDVNPLRAEQRSIIEEIAMVPMMKTEVTSMPAGMIVRTTVEEITVHRGPAMIEAMAASDTTGDRTITMDRMEAWKMIAEETALALQGRVLQPLALTPANFQKTDSTMVTMAANGTDPAITLTATTFKTNKVKTVDHGAEIPTCVAAVAAVAACIRRAKDSAKIDPDANGVAIMTVRLADQPLQNIIVQDLYATCHTHHLFYSNH